MLVLGPRFGASLPREVLGIGVKRSAKYLELTYDVELRLKSSIRSFMPKISYVAYRLHRLVSGVGEWRSSRAEECYLLFQKTVRKTLRRMIHAPRNTSSEILDYLSGWNKDRFVQLLRTLDDQVDAVSRASLEDEAEGFVCAQLSVAARPRSGDQSGRHQIRAPRDRRHPPHTQQPRVQGAPGEHSLPETSGPRPPQAAEPAAGGESL